MMNLHNRMKRGMIRKALNNARLSSPPRSKKERLRASLRNLSTRITGDPDMVSSVGDSAIDSIHIRNLRRHARVLEQVDAGKKRFAFTEAALQRITPRLRREGLLNPTAIRREKDRIDALAGRDHNRRLFYL